MKVRYAGKMLLFLLFLGHVTDCGSPSRQAPKIRAENVWSRPAVALEDQTGGMGVVYLTLMNEGRVADRLTSVESDVSEKVEIHESKTDGGRVMMERVENGIEIPAKGRIEFRPGGRHIMLIRLKRDLNPDDRFKVALRFEKSGLLVVESHVREKG